MYRVNQDLGPNVVHFDTIASSGDYMTDSRRWQILALITMALVSIGFGIWLLREGFVALGCICVGLFLWRGQQFVVWFIAPVKAPSDVTPALTSRWQRLLLSIICLLGAAVCAVGIYLCWLWPEEWQAGFVFILFGLIVLAPVTVKEIRSRRKAVAEVQPPTTD